MDKTINVEQKTDTQQRGNQISIFHSSSKTWFTRKNKNTGKKEKKKGIF